MPSECGRDARSTFGPRIQALWLPITVDFGKPHGRFHAFFILTLKSGQEVSRNRHGMLQVV